MGGRDNGRRRPSWFTLSLVTINQIESSFGSLALARTHQFARRRLSPRLSRAISGPLPGSRPRFQATSGSHLAAAAALKRPGMMIIMLSDSISSAGARSPADKAGLASPGRATMSQSKRSRAVFVCYLDTRRLLVTARRPRYRRLSGAR